MFETNTTLWRHSETLTRSLCFLLSSMIQFSEASAQSFCALQNFYVFYENIIPMPVNRNALIRYRTIDNCLKNRQKRWTLESLIKACSETLYEYEGIDKGVSKRSIQMDIQTMRSDKLGYNAPIVVLENKYYTYEDPDYSITNIPLTDRDLGKLTEVVEILRQFKGFSHFQELSGMVQRLENKIHSAKTRQEPIIDFERNDSLKGLEHIETIYNAIVNKQPMELCYQSFKARQSSTFVFHPYYLKEFRNRWFVIGVKGKDSGIMNLALDRIITIAISTNKYIPRGNFTISSLLNNVIGVTVSVGAEPEHVVFMSDHATAPYIITKPLHHSQEIVERLPEGVVFSIDVQLNFELEKELLGFGDRVKVLMPEKLKRNIKQIFNNGLDQYQNEFNNSTLQNNILKLKHKGYAVLHHVYRKKEMNAMKLMIHNHLLASGQPVNPHAIRNPLEEIPLLKDLIFNGNLKRILDFIEKKLSVSKTTYFDKTQETTDLNWHQGDNGELILQIYLDDARESNGALKVIPGSHNKKLSDDEIALITQNASSQLCEVDSGSVHVMKPLLLHASSKSTDQKHRRVIHLEFNRFELPNGLEWAEKMEF